MSRILQCIHFHPNYSRCEAVCTDTAQRFHSVPIVSGFVTNNAGSRTGHAVLRRPSEEQGGGLMPDDAQRTVLDLES
ncbi:hypothetical protein JMJ56_27520 [Belnapia sp. T18]|uniref:Uncharacterized protein n=1 Tax=Belnapia arida TaxID=2804533 RepID=A0ABS1UAL8_9PROT|nr:hypothetical protein [Belnapia arida]MBL6081736.1 hypothetical protein [Belnapia arida]